MQKHCLHGQIQYPADLLEAASVILVFQAILFLQFDNIIEAKQFLTESTYKL